MLTSLLLYLLAGLIVVLPGVSSCRRLRIGGIGCALASSLTGVLAIVDLLGRGSSQEPHILRVASWPLGYVEFGGDALSWFFCAMIGLLGAAASIYSLGYLAPKAARAETSRKSGLTDIGLPMLYLNVFVLSMQLVVLSRTALAFLGSWELMAISSYLLIVQGSLSERTQRAGFIYIVMTHIGAAFIAIAFMVLYGATGSLAFSAWAERGAALATPVKTACFLLLTAGFATKGGLVPLHVWLPRAHPQAPSHVSALMSGAMVKTAVYGFVRFIMMTLGVGAPWWGLAVLGVGLLSALVGVLGAQTQSDMKRLLAYSTVENMGLIATGLGLALLGRSLHVPALATLGFTAAMAHTLGHSLFKGLLFLGAGAVQHSAGTRDLSRLGALGRVMPKTAAAVLVGVLAIVALPPFAGFISEWYLLRSSFHLFVSQVPASYRMAGFVSGSCIALTGGLVAATFLRFYGVAFLGLPRSEGAANAREVSRLMLAPMWVLAALCVALGVLPGLTLRVIAPLAIASGLSPLAIRGLGLPLGAVLVLPFVTAGILAAVMRPASRPSALKRSETWNCGFPLEPQMQYSSGGFSQPLARAFGFKPVLESRLYRPVRDGVLSAAATLGRLQSGSIQAYIAYILVTLIVLIVASR